MISQIFILLQKDLRELSRDRGFILFVLVWCLVVMMSRVTQNLTKDMETAPPGLAGISGPEEDDTNKAEATPSQFDTNLKAKSKDNDPSNSQANSQANSQSKEKAPTETGPVKVGIQGSNSEIRKMLAADPSLKILPLEKLSPAEALAKDKVEFVIVLPPELDHVASITDRVPDDSSPVHNSPEVILLSKPGVLDSTRQNLVDAALDNIREKFVDIKMQKVGLTGAWWSLPFDYDDDQLTGPGSTQTLDTPITLPLLITFAISLITTVFAVEIVCSEEVRGTLQLLIASPVERVSILAAKTIILMIAALSSLASAITMTKGSLGLLKHHLTADPGQTVLIIAVPLVFFVASWNVFSALRYRTRGAVMSRLLPAALLSMTMAGVCALPGVAPSMDVALIPIANICGTVKQFLEGKFDLAVTTVSIVSSIFYGMLCMKQAASMLNDYGDLKSDGPARARHASNDFQMVAILFVLTVLTTFYIVRQVIICDEELGRLAAGALTVIVSLVALFLVPRDRLADVFSFKRCSWKSTLGAALLAPSIVALAWHTNMSQALTLFPEGTAELPHLLRALPIELTPAMVLCATIFYPLSRELLFRGAFQGLLQGTFDRFGLPIAVGLLSGICQSNSANFIAASAIGFILSLIVTWTRSIYPSMVLNVLIGIIVVAGTGSALNAEQLVAVSVITLVAGLLLLWWDQTQVSSENLLADAG